MKLLPIRSLASIVFCLAAPAFAAATVSSPYSGSTVSSPFTLSASASNCSNQPISVMGYSLDDSTWTAYFGGSAINTSVSAGNGGHTIHVKAWGSSGAVCVTDVPVTVGTSGSSSGPSVSSPNYGASVASPFNVSASSSSCWGQPVSAVGYSLDNSTYTFVTGGTVLNTTASSGPGGHTLHVKSWGNGGASCSTDVAINVTGTSPTAVPSVPSGATTLTNLQNQGYWSSIHDGGTPGSSSGWTGTTSSPSRSANARHFATQFSNFGGQRYSAQFGDNTSFHNFVYDAWVYVQDTTQGIANLELDLNQVMANGWTVIMGFQCDAWTHTWDYTINKGSATNSYDTWAHSNATCDLKSWATNTWHHVQIAYSRDDSGYVTYKTVTFDGYAQYINATVFSGFALGWAPTLLTNVQVGGDTSGSGWSNVYLDQLSVSAW